MTTNLISVTPDVESIVASLTILPQGNEEIGRTLCSLLADVFALFLKTQSVHWYMPGAHFRVYHPLFDSQEVQLLEASDAIEERAREKGAAAFRWASEAERNQRVDDYGKTTFSPIVMLSELCSDNLKLASFLREAHAACARFGDLATASLLNGCIDEAERRAWLLSAATAAYA